MNHDEIILRLIMGNIGDEIALKNIKHPCTVPKHCCRQ